MTDPNGLPLTFDPIEFGKIIWGHNRFIPKQEEMIRAVRDSVQTQVVACNGSGKDHTTGFIVTTFFLAPWLYYGPAYFADVERNQPAAFPFKLRHTRRCVTTSIAEDHLLVLWAEIGKWLETASVPLLLKDGGPVVLNDLQLRFKDEMHLKKPQNYVLGMVAERPEKFSGHHARYSLAVGDEASGLPDACDERFPPWAKRRLYFGNAEVCVNKFFRSGFERGDVRAETAVNGAVWLNRALRITADDSPNVQRAKEQIARKETPTGETVTPGVVSWADYVERRANLDKMRQAVVLDAKWWDGAELKLVAREWLDDARAYALCRPTSHGTVKYLGCLPDGELIETERGLAEIQTTQVGDWVYDADGKLTQVNRVYRRQYEGDMYEILPFGTTTATRFTSEHPILVLKDTKLRRNSANIRYRRMDVVWKEAKDVVAGDILRVPIRYQEVISDDELLTKMADNKRTTGYRMVDPSVILDEDFWFLTGLWLAEGWVSKGQPGFPNSRTVCLCLNAKTELALAGRVSLIVERLFDRKVNLRDRSRAKAGRVNIVSMLFGCRQYADFLTENFGQKAHGKFISEWVKRLPRRLKTALCAGYTVGDGCTREEKSGRVIEWVSISEKLLSDLQDILLSLGYMSGLTVARHGGPTVICGRACVIKRTYHLRMAARDAASLLPEMGLGKGREFFARSRHTRYGWVDGDYLYLKVRQVTRSHFSGAVNNLETGTHTYCSRMIGVHNCDPAEGGDDTCWCVIDKHGLVYLLSIKTPDTNVIFGKTMEIMRQFDVADYNVAFDRGAGQAHVDRLRAAGFPGVRSVGFGNIKNEPKRGIRVFKEKQGTVEAQGEFVQRRSQMYWEIRELLERPLTEAGAADDPIVLDALRRTAHIPKPDKPRFALPEALCGELVRQLAVVPLTYDELGRFKLIPKTNPDDPEDPKTLKYLLGRSPDQADAFALAVFAWKNKPNRQTAGPT